MWSLVTLCAKAAEKAFSTGFATKGYIRTADMRNSARRTEKKANAGELWPRCYVKPRLDKGTFREIVEPRSYARRQYIHAQRGFREEKQLRFVIFNPLLECRRRSNFLGFDFFKTYRRITFPRVSFNLDIRPQFEREISHSLAIWHVDLPFTAVYICWCPR